MFGLRFDIDSHYGLTRRTAPLLKVLDKYDAKATFFCVMGRDANLAEIAKLRLLRRPPLNGRPIYQEPDPVRLTVEPTKEPGRSSFWRHPAKIAYTMSYPRRVGSGHPDILRQIRDAGHEVYPHGWSHIQWQRNIDQIDVRKHVRLCIEAYQSIFDETPVGFASPGMVFNNSTLDAFDEYGLQFAGDMPGSAPFRPPGRHCLQIPVTTRRTISWLSWKGYSQNDIVDMLFEHIATTSYSVIFDHPDNMGSSELHILAILLERLAAQGINSRTFREILANTPSHPLISPPA